MHPTFMIVPSMSCQASCRYCFGPHQGPQMDLRTAAETVRFVHAIVSELGMEEFSVIFHGGEPLLASYEVWEALLEGLSAHPGKIPVSFNVQSNLWRLDERFLELFKKYRVSIGTSLDGPEELCDRNRGKGYFRRTMESVRKAQEAGIRPGAIVTLTKETLPQAKEILRFFRDRQINPVLHAAVRAMDQKGGDGAGDGFSLSAEEYADALIGLYPWYVKNRRYFSVSTLDQYCSAVVQGDPEVCNLQECLGMFLAISATGDITCCQRMSAKDEFRIGNVFDHPRMAELMASPAWKRLEKRQQEVRERCKDCGWLKVCYGGCYYNALVSGDGVIDPFCNAIRRIFDYLQERVIEEVGSEENIAAIQRRPANKDENPLLRDGLFISLAKKPHPSKVAENARRILAAYLLGKYSDPDAAARHMVDAGISADLSSTAHALKAMEKSLRRQPEAFNNCYIHTTFRCNLRCSHCYASAGERSEEMPVRDMERLAKEALDVKFRQLVITGGEPLFHKDRTGLIGLCAQLRGRGSNIVLRTNLCGSFEKEELERIAEAFDQVVVSIDGNAESHDARRGKGSYANTVANCERYAAIAEKIRESGELSLACVLSAAEINGGPGESVRKLGDRLGVRRVRFRPLLPLGRAAGAKEPLFCECINQHEPIEEILRLPFTPMISCGIGQNVYICPDGKAYPCYAWQTEHSYLGNVLEHGLGEVLAAPVFTRLRACTVETIEKCRDCELRYLCGGACRAWGNREEKDPDTAPPECAHLQVRARELIAAAEKFLA